MSKVDELQLYFGDPLVINDALVIRQPTVGDVIAIGEEAYYGTVYSLTAISSDMKSALWDVGIDWTEFSDLETFALMTAYLTPDQTGVFFGDLDLSGFKLYKRDDGELFLQNGSGIVIDRYIHKQISDFLCMIHGIKKSPERAGNKHTKMIMIEDERERREAQAKKEFHSNLLPLISAMVNSAGFKYTIEQIRGMPLYAFMDSVMRIQTIKSVDHLTDAFYSGNIDTKKFDKRKLDWMCDFSKKR